MISLFLLPLLRNYWIKKVKGSVSNSVIPKRSNEDQGLISSYLNYLKKNKRVLRTMSDSITIPVLNYQTALYIVLIQQF